jgi:hypothetical protein
MKYLIFLFNLAHDVKLRGDLCEDSVVTLYKRQRSPNLVIEVLHLGQYVRRSSGTTSNVEAKALEQKWKREIYERAPLGKSPTIKRGEATARYFEATLKPGGNPPKLARDLDCIKQIKDDFGADRKLNDLIQVEVAR